MSLAPTETPTKSWTEITLACPCKEELFCVNAALPGGPVKEAWIIGCSQCVGTIELTDLLVEQRIIAEWESAMLDKLDEAASDLSTSVQPRGIKCHSKTHVGKLRGNNACDQKFCRVCCTASGGCRSVHRVHELPTAYLSEPDEAFLSTVSPGLPYKNFAMPFSRLALAEKSRSRVHPEDPLRVLAGQAALRVRASVFVWGKNGYPSEKITTTVAPGPTFRLSDVVQLHRALRYDGTMHDPETFQFQWFARRKFGRQRDWETIQLDHAIRAEPSSTYFIRLLGVTDCVGLEEITGVRQAPASPAELGEAGGTEAEPETPTKKSKSGNQALVFKSAAVWDARLFPLSKLVDACRDYQARTTSSKHARWSHFVFNRHFSKFMPWFKDGKENKATFRRIILHVAAGQYLWERALEKAQSWEVFSAEVTHNKGITAAGDDIEDDIEEDEGQS